MAKDINPDKVSISFGTYSIDGIADGTFISVERNADSFNLSVGADGEGARVKTNNRSGRVRVTLMQTSASNDILSGLMNADELSGSSQLPLLIKDNSPNGRTIISAEKAWIVRPTVVEYSNEATTGEWIFETDVLVMVNIGGN